MLVCNSNPTDLLNTLGKNEKADCTPGPFAQYRCLTLLMLAMANPHSHIQNCCGKPFLLIPIVFEMHVCSGAFSHTVTIVYNGFFTFMLVDLPIPHLFFLCCLDNLHASGEILEWGFGSLPFQP